MNSHIPPGSGIHPVREKKTNKPGKIRSQAERSTKHHMPPNPTGLRWLEGWERPCHRFQLVTCWPSVLVVVLILFCPRAPVGPNLRFGTGGPGGCQV